jgi:hypothetical protein
LYAHIIGSSTLYDTRLLHGGGANNSPRDRWLFYATFAASRSIADEFHGREYSALQRAAHTVSTLQNRGDTSNNNNKSEDEAKEWEAVWAAMKKRSDEDE